MRVPGDKSMAHRALLLALVSDCASRIEGLPRSGDVQSTVGALRTLGAHVDDDGTITPGALRDGATIDCGNAGTLTRLLTGLLVGRGVAATLVGDASLSRRPMRRVATPLAQLWGRDVVTLTRDGTLPLQTHAHAAPQGDRTVVVDVASAQVRSAVLLAALSRDGATTLRGPGPTRDHTERMLRALGASVDLVVHDDGSCVSTLRGPFVPRGVQLRVPGDPSSAAFLLGLAAMRSGAQLVVDDVLLNPHRIGFLDVLRRAGAEVRCVVHEERAGEAVGRIAIDGRALRGVELRAAEVPAVVDEVVLLAALLCTAEGPSRLRGLVELRVKESDRVAGTAELCRAFGARVDVDGDDLIVHGGLRRASSSRVHVQAHGDHRLAMAARVLAQHLDVDVVLDTPGCEDVSFPGFGDSLHEAARLCGA